MKPWMIEKIENERRKNSRTRRIQPHLPAPPPISEDLPRRENLPPNERGASNISFEV